MANDTFDLHPVSIGESLQRSSQEDAQGDGRADGMASAQKMDAPQAKSQEQLETEFASISKPPDLAIPTTDNHAEHVTHDLHWSGELAKHSREEMEKLPPPGSQVPPEDTTDRNVILHNPFEKIPDDPRYLSKEAQETELRTRESRRTRQAAKDEAPIDGLPPLPAPDDHSLSADLARVHRSFAEAYANDAITFWSAGSLNRETIRYLPEDQQRKIMAERTAAREAQAKLDEEVRQGRRRAMSFYGDAIDQLASGVISAPGEIVETLGHGYNVAAGWLGHAVGSDAPIARTNSAVEVGKWAQAWGKRMFPTDASRADEFGHQLAAGVGGVASFALGNEAGVALKLGKDGKLGGIIATAALGALTMANSQYDAALEARDQGRAVSDLQLTTVLVGNMVLGAGMAYPITQKLPGLTYKTKSTALAYLQSVNREAAGFGAVMGGQTFLQNFIARANYNPNQGFFDGVGPAMFMGYLSGGALGTMKLVDPRARATALMEAASGKAAHDWPNGVPPVADSPAAPSERSRRGLGVDATRPSGGGEFPAPEPVAPTTDLNAISGMARRKDGKPLDPPLRAPSQKTLADIARHPAFPVDGAGDKDYVTFKEMMAQVSGGKRVWNSLTREERAKVEAVLEALSPTAPPTPQQPIVKAQPSRPIKTTATSVATQVAAPRSAGSPVTSAMLTDVSRARATAEGAALLEQAREMMGGKETSDGSLVAPHFDTRSEYDTAISALDFQVQQAQAELKAAQDAESTATGKNGKRTAASDLVEARATLDDLMRERDALGRGRDDLLQSQPDLLDADRQQAKDLHNAGVPAAEWPADALKAGLQDGTARIDAEGTPRRGVIEPEAPRGVFDKAKRAEIAQQADDAVSLLVPDGWAEEAKVIIDPVAMRRLVDNLDTLTDEQIKTEYSNVARLQRVQNREQLLAKTAIGIMAHHSLERYDAPMTDDARDIIEQIVEDALEGKSVGQSIEAVAVDHAVNTVVDEALRTIKHFDKDALAQAAEMGRQALEKGKSRIAVQSTAFMDFLDENRGRARELIDAFTAAYDQAKVAGPVIQAAIERGTKSDGVHAPEKTVEEIIADVVPPGPAIVLGSIETVSLPGLGLGDIRAKVDTGAQTSSLHAVDIHYDENVNQVTFNTTDENGRSKQARASVVDERRIKSSNGSVSTRYVIMTEINLGGRRYPIEVTLADRSSMEYPMLIGRQAIKPGMLVDVLKGQPVPVEPQQAIRTHDQLRDYRDVTIDGHQGVEGVDRHEQAFGSVKQAFLKDANTYFKKVSKELSARGFGPHTETTRKGKAKALEEVSVNRGGSAGSGEVSLKVVDQNGNGAYVQISGAIHEGGGIRILARKSSREDRYGVKSYNQWWPDDLTVTQMADRIEQMARGTPSPAADVRPTGMKVIIDQSPPTAREPFDPYAFSTVVVMTKEGRDALGERLKKIESKEDLLALARAQHLGVEDAHATLDDLRAAIVEGTQRRIANRQAAASGYDGFVERGLRANAKEQQVSPAEPVAPTPEKIVDAKLEAVPDVTNSQVRTYAVALEQIGTDISLFHDMMAKLTKDKTFRLTDLNALAKVYGGADTKPARSKKDALKRIEDVFIARTRGEVDEAVLSGDKSIISRDLEDQAHARREAKRDRRLREGERAISDGSLSEAVSADAEGRDVGGTLPGDGGGSGGDVQPHGGGDAPQGDGKRADALQPSGGGDAARPNRGERGRDARRDIGAAERLEARQQVDAEREARRRKNYRITEADELGKGGPKAKVRGNIEAIRILKRLEEESRPATPEEKQALVKYVGWGAFAQDVFSDRKDEWKAERQQLTDLLTAEEYDAAKASTLNAHYTSPEVVAGMWGALEHLGYAGGRALEPSAGVGHFLGLAPERLAAKTDWTAVELDKLTGGILKHLYEGSDVRVDGFEKVAFPDNFFDLAISNVPFGQYTLTDRKYSKLLIHDYFFAKSLDKVRPGGVVAFITSSGTLDKEGTQARRLMSEKADLVGAIRLPGGDKGALAANAGTRVTTDILFLRKRVPGEVVNPDAPKWLETVEHTTPDGPTKLNEYFAAHPEMMLGEMRLTGTMYREKSPVLIGPSARLGERILEAAKKLPSNVFASRVQAVEPVAQPVLSGDGFKEGALFLKGGQLFQNVLGQAVPQKAVGKTLGRMRQLLGLRDVVNDLMGNQGKGDAGDMRKALNKAYDAFVKEFGPINKEVTTVSTRKDGTETTTRRYPNLEGAMDDPDIFKVAAIENYDPETGKASKRAIFTADIIRPYERPEITGPADAMAVSLNETGGIDLPRIAEMLGTTEDEAASKLGPAIYRDPNGETWRPSEIYLSGDVVSKLEAAREAAKTDPVYERNVAALEAVQPAPLTRVDIRTNFGAPWVPAEHYNEFIAKVLMIRGGNIAYEPISATWVFERGDKPYVPPSSQAAYGTDRVSVKDILMAALNNKPVKVFDPGDKDTRVLNVEATQQAEIKSKLLKEAFTGDPNAGVPGWIYEDDARAQKLEAIYNNKFNRLVPTKYDGEHLSLPGLATTLAATDGKTVPFGLLPHQKNVVWRIIQSGNTLMDHAVGAGKTYAAIAAGMEMKRLGMIQRPAYIVPNHMLEQFSREWLQAYPGAKLLIADKTKMEAKNRKAFAARIAAEQWDGIIMTHSGFGRIPMRDEAYIEHLKTEQAEIMEAFAEAKDEDKRSPTVKALERKKKQIEAKLEKLLAKDRKDAGVTFEELGVDQLFVDEAHQFKNLDYQSQHANVKGIGVKGSQRATDLLLKIRHLERSRPGRSTVFMTGTPMSRSMAEIYTMQRYLQNDLLREYGIDRFDTWARTFGQIVSQTELAPNGRDLKDTTSFSKFTNVPELQALYSRMADSVTANDLDLPRPALKAGRPQVVEAELSPGEERQIQEVIELIANLRGPAVKGKDNHLSLFTRGLQISTDARLVDDRGEFNPNGKVAKVVANVADIYKQGKAPALAQMIFLDMGIPGSRGKARVIAADAGDASKIDKVRAKLTGDDEGDVEAEDQAQIDGLLAGRFNLYQDIKTRLVDEGVPEDEIAFIHDAKNDDQKAKLFRAVREGKVRVLLGSSAKMGVGTNVQRYLTAMHHVDAPWNPADVVQRDGRILRQGNENKEVSIFRYITKRSFEAYRWQLLDRKSQFEGQFRAGARGLREAEDIDSPLPEASELKAAASGDPRIIEYAELTKSIREMEAGKRGHERSSLNAKRSLAITQAEIGRIGDALAKYEQDAKLVTDTSGKNFVMRLDTATAQGDVRERKAAGEAIKTAVLDGLRHHWGREPERIELGAISGFQAYAMGRKSDQGVVVRFGIEGAASYEPSGGDRRISPESEPVGIAQQFERLVQAIPGLAKDAANRLAEKQVDVPRMEKQAVATPYPKAAALALAKARHEELSAALKPKAPGEQKPGTLPIDSTMTVREAFDDDAGVVDSNLNELSAFADTPDDGIRRNATGHEMKLPFKDEWGDPRFNPQDRAKAMETFKQIQAIDVRKAPWDVLLNARRGLNEIAAQMFYYDASTRIEEIRSNTEDFGAGTHYAIEHIRERSGIPPHENIVSLFRNPPEDIADLMSEGARALDHLLAAKRRGVDNMLAFNELEEPGHGRPRVVPIDPKDVGKMLPSGFYFKSGRLLSKIPDATLQLGGRAVFNWLSQAGVTRSELYHFKLLDKLGYEKPVTREEIAKAIADRMFDFRRKMSYLNPERVVRQGGAADYGQSDRTRVFRGPRIPGRGIYFEKLMAFPKRLKGGEEFPPGTFTSPHWENELKGTWASTRGSIRDMPEFGKTVVIEESQVDMMQGAVREDNARPRISSEEFNKRKEDSAKYHKVMQKAEGLLREGLGVIGTYEERFKIAQELIPSLAGREQEQVKWKQLLNDLRDRYGDKVGRTSLDKLEALHQDNEQWFAPGSRAKYYDAVDHERTPETPLDDNYVRTLVRDMIITAAKEKAESLAISTSETTDRIQSNTYRSAAHFYDKQLKPALEKELRGQTGDGSIVLTKVAVPKAMGGPRNEKPYTVWIVRLPRELIDKVNAEGQPMMALGGKNPRQLMQDIPQLAGWIAGRMGIDPKSAEAIARQHLGSGVDLARKVVDGVSNDLKSMYGIDRDTLYGQGPFTGAKEARYQDDMRRHELRQELVKEARNELWRQERMARAGDELNREGRADAEGAPGAEASALARPERFAVGAVLGDPAARERAIDAFLAPELRTEQVTARAEAQGFRRTGSFMGSTTGGRSRLMHVNLNSDRAPSLAARIWQAVAGSSGTEQAAPVRIRALNPLRIRLPKSDLLWSPEPEPKYSPDTVRAALADPSNDIPEALRREVMKLHEDDMEGLLQAMEWHGYDGIHIDDNRGGGSMHVWDESSVRSTDDAFHSDAAGAEGLHASDAYVAQEAARRLERSMAEEGLIGEAKTFDQMADIPTSPVPAIKADLPREATPASLQEIIDRMDRMGPMEREAVTQWLDDMAAKETEQGEEIAKACAGISGGFSINEDRG